MELHVPIIFELQYLHRFFHLLSSPFFSFSLFNILASFQAMLWCCFQKGWVIPNLTISPPLVLFWCFFKRISSAIPVSPMHFCSHAQVLTRWNFWCLIVYLLVRRFRRVFCESKMMSMLYYFPSLPIFSDRPFTYGNPLIRCWCDLFFITFFHYFIVGFAFVSAIYEIFSVTGDLNLQCF